MTHMFFYAHCAFIELVSLADIQRKQKLLSFKKRGVESGEAFQLSTI